MQEITNFRNEFRNENEKLKLHFFGSLCIHLIAKIFFLIQQKY